MRHAAVGGEGGRDAKAAELLRKRTSHLFVVKSRTSWVRQRGHHMQLTQSIESVHTPHRGFTEKSEVNQRDAGKCALIMMTTSYMRTSCFSPLVTP